MEKVIQEKNKKLKEYRDIYEEAQLHIQIFFADVEKVDVLYKTYDFLFFNFLTNIG
jgi:hypothetical protein